MDIQHETTKITYGNIPDCGIVAFRKEGFGDATVRE